MTRAFRKIFLFHSILFIFECDVGTLRGKVTTHTLKVWRETRFVKPIPIYDIFIILVKRCRWQHVVTTQGALHYSTDPRYPEKSAPRRSRPRRTRPRGEVGPRRTRPHEPKNSAPSAGELGPLQPENSAPWLENSAPQCDSLKWLDIVMYFLFFV